MQIVIAPDNKLRIKTKAVKKVTPQLLSIVEEMVKLTETFKDPEGVGLASVQIGRDEKLFIAKKKNKEFMPVFNAQILTYGKKNKVFFEGCLSVPNYYAEIARPTTVKVKYMDEFGNIVTKNLTGMDAWIFQHEVDHLEGKLFVDKVLEQKSKIFKVVGKDRAGAEIFEEIRL